MLWNGNFSKRVARHFDVSLGVQVGCVVGRPRKRGEVRRAPSYLPARGLSSYNTCALLHVWWQVAAGAQWLLAALLSASTALRKVCLNNMCRYM